MQFSTSAKFSKFSTMPTCKNFYTYIIFIRTNLILITESSYFSYFPEKQVITHLLFSLPSMFGNK